MILQFIGSATVTCFIVKVFCIIIITFVFFVSSKRIIGVRRRSSKDTNRKCNITKYSSALYIGMAKVFPIIDVLGYGGQNSSFFSSPPHSDSTPITQKGSHIST